MQKSKKNNTSADDEIALMKLTEEALADVLGRRPTRQEVLRLHAGFKRMAFILWNHLERGRSVE